MAALPKIANIWNEACTFERYSNYFWGRFSTNSNQLEFYKSEYSDERDRWHTQKSKRAKKEDEATLYYILGLNQHAFYLSFKIKLGMPRYWVICTIQKYLNNNLAESTLHSNILQRFHTLIW